MKVISVNVGLPREIKWGDKWVQSAIFKTPVYKRILVGRLNLEGDAQADLIGHGGEHRAVMVYQRESYDYWKKTLGLDKLEYGQLGENLTIEGLSDNEVYIGDHFQIGTAVFEVTQPRVTCYKVGISTGIAEMPSLLVKHKRPGFYFRVITEGEVGAGDVIRKIKDGPERMSVADIDSLLYLNEHPKEKLEQALKIPALSDGWHGAFEALLKTDPNIPNARNPSLTGPDRQLPAWKGFKRYCIQHTQMLTESIRSFDLTPADGSVLPDFLPGQHIAVRIRKEGSLDKVIRMYSLCGPAKGKTLRIAVKKIIDGAESGYLHSNLSVGDMLEISAPRGAFVLSKNKKPVAFFSAGIGITPMISMLYALRLSDPDRKIWWVHSTKNGKNEAFREEVRSLTSMFSDLKRTIVYSSPEENDLYKIDYDHEGHLSTEVVEGLGLPLESECYLCGPLEYLRITGSALRSLGIPEEQLKSEIFSTELPLWQGRKKSPHPPKKDSGKGPVITFIKSQVTMRWDPRYGSLLEAAEDCDIPVQWSCRSGVCHRCETPVIEGSVNYLIEPLGPAAVNHVLVCCSVPKDDIVLDL